MNVTSLEQQPTEKDVFELIAGPIPRGQFRVLSFRGTEALSKLFRFDVEFLADLEPAVLEPMLLAQPASLAIHGLADRPRIVRGIVNRCTLLGFDQREGRHRYEVRVVPRMWLLRRRLRSRIYQDLGLPDIVSAVLREMDVRFRFQLRRTSPTRGYCVQYQETDYQFVTRLCAEEGIFFYFEPPALDLDLLVPPILSDATQSFAADEDPALETVVFADSAEAYPPMQDTSGVIDTAERALEAVGFDAQVTLPGGLATISLAPTLPFRDQEGMTIDEEHVSVLRNRRQLRSKSIHIRDWNFKHPTLDLNARAKVAPVDAQARMSSAPASLLGGSLPAAGALHVEVETSAAIDPSLLEVFSHHGEYEEPEVQRELASIALEQLRRDVRIFEGKSNCRRLNPGHRLKVEGHAEPSLEREYVVIGVEHEGRIPERAEEATRPLIYRNRFVVGSAGAAHRPRRPPHHKLQQVLESAIVVGPPEEEIHTDEHGRVKVQFHWDREGQHDDHSSCWIRVAQAWAGTGYGVQFVPRIGMEVMVSFLGGDEDRPVILGCVSNQTHPPPFRLPLSKTRSGIRTNSTPKSVGYNELSFEDAAGGELVYLHAQHDLTVDVKHDAATHIEHDARTNILGQQAIDVGGDRRLTVKGAEAHSIGGVSQRRVGGDENLAVGGMQRVVVDGPTTAAMSGANTHNRGDHSLFVEGSSTTSVGIEDRPGVLGFFVQGNEVHEATKRITLRADAGLVFECGDSSITLTTDGIRIQSKKVVVKGTESVTVFGKGPAAELTDKVDVCADSINLFAKGCSVELGSDLIKLESSQVDIGTDPEKGEIKDDEPKPETKKFKWKLLDEDREPIKGKTYRFLTQGLRKKGTTDDEGTIELDVPKDAVLADVTVWTRDFPTGPRLHYTFRLDDLPPSSSVYGAVLRLKNLGYYQGKLVDEMTPELETAVRAFQQDNGLPPTGEIDGATSGKLDEVHPTA